MFAVHFSWTRKMLKLIAVLRVEFWSVDEVDIPSQIRIVSPPAGLGPKNEKFIPPPLLEVWEENCSTICALCNLYNHAFLLRLDNHQPPPPTRWRGQRLPNLLRLLELQLPGLERKLAKLREVTKSIPAGEKDVRRRNHLRWNFLRKINQPDWLTWDLWFYDDEMQENLWEFELLRDDDGIHRFFLCWCFTCWLENLEKWSSQSDFRQPCLDKMAKIDNGKM